MSERTEALMRILVVIVSGLIIGIWKLLVDIASIFHWLYVIFMGKRIRGLAEFSNLWATQAYRLMRYMTFTTNSRPFPFSSLGSALHPVDMKKK